MLNGRSCTWENNIEMSINEIRYKEGDSVELVPGLERELWHTIQSNLLRPVCNFLRTFHELNSFLVCYWPWEWKYRPDNISVADIITEVAHLDSWIVQTSDCQGHVDLLTEHLTHSLFTWTPPHSIRLAERFLWFVIYATHFYPYWAKSIKWTYYGEGGPLLQHTYLRQY
jgi:hypothetical protein